MYRNLLFGCIVACLLLSGGIAQSGISNSDMIEYDRRLAETATIPLPSAGVVPDADTAKAIAEAVATPVFGKKLVQSELPLRAGLKGDVWTVIGTPKLKGVGGELIVQVNKKTGAILSLVHTQ